MSRACGTCSYSTVEVGDDNEPRLDCHRFPPTVIAVEFIDDNEAPLMVWPQVLADDWCGEYRSSVPQQSWGPR